MWITRKRTRLVGGLAAVLMTFAAASAFAGDEPIELRDEKTAIRSLTLAALDSNSLFYGGMESPVDGIGRLDLAGLNFTKLVGEDSYNDSITLLDARDGVLAYVKSSRARTPRGYGGRTVNRLIVSNRAGKRRRVIHREFELESTSNRSNECGRQISALQLLPRKQVQIIVAEYGRRTAGIRCAPATSNLLRHRQRQLAIRFSVSGKRILTRRFRIKGDQRHQAGHFRVSRNGRYLLNPESSRVRVVDIVTGRARFVRLRQGSSQLLAFPGFGRAAAIVARNPRKNGGFSYEFRMYRNILKPARFRRIASHPDGLYFRPVWCGKQMYMQGTYEPDSIIRVGEKGNRQKFYDFPEGESLEAFVCNRNRAAVFSFGEDGESRLLRLKSLRSNESP